MSAPMLVHTYARMKYFYPVFRSISTAYHAVCKEKRGGYKKRFKSQLKIIPAIYDKEQSKHTEEKRRKTHTGPTGEEKGETEQSLCTLVNNRLMEGKRSVLVKMDKNTSLDNVLAFVQKNCGAVMKAIHFKEGQTKSFVLVELKEETHTNGEQYKKESFSPENVSTYIPKIVDVKCLNSCKSISEQMLYLYTNLQLSEEVVRCHFFICSEVDRIIKKGINKECQVLPFGSAACGLAMEGSSDLDMVLVQNDQPVDDNLLQTRLSKVNKILEQNPSFTKIFFIRHARVPIITFDEKLTKVSCDIGCNVAGLLMAETLYWLSEYDSRFYPLVFTIKYWAKMKHLNKKKPPIGLSNFMLTILVMAFLQQEAILPALNYLYTNTRHQNTGTPALQLWQSLRPIKPHTCIYGTELGILLVNFFEFWRNFSFSDFYIDVLSGTIVECSHGYPMCALNPHEKGHNICKNVKRNYIDYFQRECAEAAETLKQNAQKNTSDSWGVACILSENQQKRRAVLDLDKIYNPDVEEDKLIFEIGDDIETL